MSQLRIMHVTEAMGGGTLQVMAQLARAQADDGASVYVLYAVRSDTPGADALDRLLPSPIMRAEVSLRGMPALISAFRALTRLRREVRRFNPDVIHLHSSKAGGVGRVLCAVIGFRHVFYSPHGFSFLRLDVSRFKRRLFLGMERVLAKLGGRTIACSPSEAILAEQLVRTNNVSIVENAINIESVVPARGSNDDVVRIMSSGRLCYQKAPWRFLSMARNLRIKNTVFTWVGAGEEKYQSALEQEGCVNVTGWMEQKEVLHTIADADIYVLLSLWEGMPLVVIEAQAAGIPAVVSDVVGSKDIVVDGVTGYVCRSDDEALSRIRELTNDPGLRRSMGAAARRIATQRFDVKRMHSQFMAVYEASLRRSQDSPSNCSGTPG